MTSKIGLTNHIKTEMLTNHTRTEIIENLIKSAETLKAVYERLIKQPESKHKKLRDAYNLNEEQINLLKKYQSERQ